ncbi:putative flagellar glycosyl transferase [Xanthomonas citri pv. fuscans]|nr:putative flagellar glycosyl transferase [Xanthomonas citri pv. fuscans]
MSLRKIPRGLRTRSAWLPMMANDPAYNPGFSLDPGAGFALADPRASWRPLQSWRPLPSVIALPADIEGCGHYRVIQPLRALREAGIAEGVLFNGYLEISELARQDPDVVILQRQVGEARLDAMRRMKALSRAFKVYELDDYLPNLPPAVTPSNNCWPFTSTTTTRSLAPTARLVTTRRPSVLRNPLPGMRLSNQPRPTISTSTNSNAKTAPNRLGEDGACAPTWVALAATGAAAASRPITAASGSVRWG